MVITDDEIDLRPFLRSVIGVVKWHILQLVLYFQLPYVWDYDYAYGTLILMLAYTLLYIVYGEYIHWDIGWRWVLIPYLLYMCIAVALYFLFDNFVGSICFCGILPLYGLTCLVSIKLSNKYLKRLGRWCRCGNMIRNTAVVLILVLLKLISSAWLCEKYSTGDGKKNDIIERRNYLVEKLVTTPQGVLEEMPSSIGVQFQGEWALYLCSMFTASLVNISRLYPETRTENLGYIQRLIEIVKSREIRYYDTLRWGKDALNSLDGEDSHVSYLSHLAWMICGYKEIGGDCRYDDLLEDVCKAMNRRLLESKGFNLPTYPGEPIYIPDMLVAIVALDKYSNLHNGKYKATVDRWVERARKDWVDKKSGLLVSFLKDDGTMYDDAPIKGAYSALNCYYLTLIDGDFAREQYIRLKSLFLKNGLLCGLKEYWDRSFYFGFDIDAGPIVYELSPSGTAFLVGSTVFYNDSMISRRLLRTAEIAGHTFKIANKRHYLLAEFALVGEAIMLAMRTNDAENENW